MTGKPGFIILLLILNACASIPEPNGNQLVADKPLESVAEEQGRSVSRYLDAARLSEISRYALPDIALSLPVELRTVAFEERGMTTTFFFGQYVHFRFKLGVRLD